MRPVFYVLLMLVVLLFVFAITFKTQASGDPDLADLFPSIMDTMSMLLLRGTFLDSPSLTFYRIQDRSTPLALVFLIFIFLSSFTVLNMLIGILCDVVFEVTRAEKDDAALEIMKRTMFNLLECYDKNTDHRLGISEFDLLMANPETGQILRRFDVDVGGLRSLRDVLFEQGSGQQEKTITFADFLEVILRLRGGNSATVTDVMDLREYTKGQLADLRSDVRELSESMKDRFDKADVRFNQIDVQLNAIQDMLKVGFARRLARRSSARVPKVHEPMVLPTSPTSRDASSCDEVEELDDLTPQELVTPELSPSSTVPPCQVSHHDGESDHVTPLLPVTPVLPVRFSLE